MRDVAREFLHGSVGGHCGSVDRERSHHANHVSLEECTPTSEPVLLAEARHHVGVLEFSEFVGLHESFNIIERIVKDPVHSTTEATCDQRYINGHLMMM